MRTSPATEPTTSPHIGIDTAWLQSHSEPVLEPQLPIVDAHHHLWGEPRTRYLLEDALADFGSGHNVVATVFVECREAYRQGGDEALRSLGETEFATGVAERSAGGAHGATRVCEAIVGYVDLRLGDRAGAVLEAHRAASGGRLKGIRNIAAWHEHPDIRTTSIPYPKDALQDVEFRKGFAQLDRLGLAFDSWLYHSQLSQLLDLAEAFPGTTIVVDHAGGPVRIGPYADQPAEAFAQWRSAMAKLATLPNVVVKIGGLGMRVNGFRFHERETAPSSQVLADAWRDHVSQTIDLFSPGRCMFESNFPVDKGSYGYAVLWNAFKRLTAGYSASERASLFHGTAARVYGLSL